MELLILLHGPKKKPDELLLFGTYERNGCVTSSLYLSFKQFRPQTILRHGGRRYRLRTPVALVGEVTRVDAAHPIVLEVL